MEREGFLGVPAHSFEEAGRSQLVMLLNHGMRHESKVLDFGCGCLRIAYWLIRFLDRDCYCGVEPARKRVDLGLRYLFAQELVNDKRPRFDNNETFDSSSFGEKFDYFLARSIWTHGSKRQVQASLDSFVRDSRHNSTFLASYLPAASTGEDYTGDFWVGTSHQSDLPGVIRHRLSWIIEQCAMRNLAVTELPGIDCDSQLWLRITNQGFEASL